MTDSNLRPLPRVLLSLGLALVTAAVACDGELPEDHHETDDGDETEGDDETESDGDVEFRIVDPTPVPAGDLMGMVQVSTSRGSCSGMLIARDTVVTAAHCFCSENLVGGNVCSSSATVTFRDDPATAGTNLPTRTGTAVIHPSYNPSWTDNQFENDLAVITLASNAPSYVTPFDVTFGNPASGTTVKIAGYGLVGSGCTGTFGTLNYDIVTIDGYEDGGKIMRFNDPVFCSGDSGGAIMDVAGTKLYGVHSSRNFTFWHGWVSKSMALAPQRTWVKGHTCSSAFWDACDDKGPICQCGAGGGDCDFDGDCRGSLVCSHDVGALYGFPSTADVCVDPNGGGGGWPGDPCGCTGDGCHCL